MTTELYISKKDLEKILKIVQENKLNEKTFKLIQDNSSGIGYTTSIEFDYVLNGSDATVRMDIATSEDW